MDAAMLRASTSRKTAPRPRWAALGLKVRNGCTYHGFALNLDMDLAPFDDIDPCGYRGLAVTQLSDLGVRAPRAEIEDRLVSEVVEAIAGVDRTRK